MIQQVTYRELVSSAYTKIKIFNQQVFFFADDLEIMMDQQSSEITEESPQEKLLKVLKKEVKHIMEESVMLKCVHEDSASVTSLCLSVDACLSYGLKRRALGLFKTR